MLVLDIPGRETDAEQPGSRLCEELISHIALISVACDFSPGSLVIRGGRVRHRGGKSLPQGHRAKWMGKCSRILSTTVPLLRDGGYFPPAENLPSGGLQWTCDLQGTGSSGKRVAKKVPRNFMAPLSLPRY